MMLHVIAALAALLFASGNHSAVTSADRGWGIGPNGAPVRAASSDQGSMIDPDGKPRGANALSRDAGGAMDPNGRT
jgi:hypothetical protein